MQELSLVWIDEQPERVIYDRSKGVLITPPLLSGAVCWVRGMMWPQRVANPPVQTAREESMIVFASGLPSAITFAECVANVHADKPDVRGTMLIKPLPSSRLIWTDYRGGSLTGREVR